MEKSAKSLARQHQEETLRQATLKLTIQSENLSWEIRRFLSNQSYANSALIVLDRIKTAA